MRARPHFPWADNVNEGWRWIIKDEQSGCKQCLSKPKQRNAYRAPLFISWSGIKR